MPENFPWLLFISITVLLFAGAHALSLRLRKQSAAAYQSEQILFYSGMSTTARKLSAELTRRGVPHVWSGGKVYAARMYMADVTNARNAICEQ